MNKTLEIICVVLFVICFIRFVLGLYKNRWSWIISGYSVMLYVGVIYIMMIMRAI